jgi:hypothetical protein
LAYQPPDSSNFLSEQISYQQPASSTFLSEQTSTGDQPPAKRTGWLSPYLPAPSSRAARWEPRGLAPSPSGVVRLAGGEGTDHRGVVLGGTRRDGNGNGNIMLMETR